MWNAAPWLARGAFAADPGAHATQTPMVTTLLLIGVVGTAYLLAHFVVERAQQRFLFVSGLEYVALGAVLGPWVLPQIQPFSDLTRLAPIFAFAAGWVGLLHGLALELRTVEVRALPVRIGVFDAMVTGGVVAFAAYAAFTSPLFATLVGAPAGASAESAALFLGCAAAAGSSSAIELLSQRYGDLTTRLLPMLRRVTWLGDVLAIVAYGLVFCFYHVGGSALPVGSGAWVGLSLGLGVVLGLLFALFVGGDPSDRTVFLGMVGILLLASGAAFFLHLSALLVNLVLGVVIAQTRHGPVLRLELERTAKPARLVLLLFAGAHWRPVPIGAAVLTLAAYLGLRLAAKVVSTSLATFGTPLRIDLFRGLVAQGDVAVAMALAFRIVYDGPAVDLAYTAVLASVVLQEFVSPRLLRGLLVDAGELREDIGPVTLTPDAAGAGGRREDR